MFTQRAANVLVAIVTLAVISACGSAADQQRPVQLTVDAISTPTSVRDLSLPFQNYEYSTEEWDGTILKAEYLLQQACAARFGVFDIGDSTIRMSDPMNMVARYGALDRDWVSEHGYAPPPGSSDYNPPAEELDWALPSVDAQRVLTGGPGSENLRDANGNPIPEGGCVAASEATVDTAAVRAAGIETVAITRDELYQRSQHEPLVEEAGEKWVACMKESGYPQSTRWEPWHVTKAVPGKSNHEDITRALTDLECRTETNLIGIWNAVESELQRRELKANPEKYAAVKAAKDRSLQLARDAIARS